MSNSAPVRVRLRYADLDTFVERFAPNVTRGGIFLASRARRPVGDSFYFEVQLADGQVALAGDGKVIWVKEPDPAAPQKPHGMGVQFTRLDPASRETLNRMLRVKGTARPSQPVRPLAAGAPVNGSGARPHVDTSVDVAAELGVDDAALRRAIDRHRRPTPVATRVSDDDLDELLKPEPVEPATLAQALAELPRLLDPSRRRITGALRTLEPPAGAGAGPPKKDDPS